MPRNDSIDQQYPSIAAWIKDGTIEIGRCDYTKSFIRASDDGGIIWEGAEKYNSLGDALTDLDQGIAKWLEEN